MKRTILSFLLPLLALAMQAQIQEQPIDREATGPTRQLYNYLLGKVWGKQVLSGCQAEWDYNTTDADGIYERAGKYPAINIFDFQHFRQRNLNYMRPTTKAWNDAGGIVGFIWHWSVPVSADLSPKDGFAFYTPSGAEGRRPGTLFSARRAVQEGTPEQRIINENLDTIASYLLHYQRQGIPILWRPFHEAAGNTNRGGKAWFWWGNDGADAFKQLYLYAQRYLMERGVHNLIYIWTSELGDDDWSPGDAYVDIVARDQYHAPSQHGSFKQQFDLLRSKYPSKMLALAECDCVPSAQAMEKDDARWLFVAPWTVPFVFSQQNDDAFWRQFLAEKLILTRDEVNRASSYRLSINKESGVYEKGERAVVSCHAVPMPFDSLHVRVLYNNKVCREFSLLPSSTDFTVLEQALDSTCAVMVEVKEHTGRPEAIGYVVAPDGFRAGFEEPADLMSYWDNQKQQLRALPMQVKTMPLDVPQLYQGKYTCQDVEINCLGPAPVRAYMAKPVGAKKKSLPIIILCRAAGVSGNWCRCSVDECVGNASLGNGALSLDINAHGMLNGQSDDFYRMLEGGPLRNYYEHNAADRETYYFRGMYLRLLRAIEYMTRQPEWDGRRILVIGESQGGGQAVAAAGLDPRVSAIVLNVPAMQDLGGARKGRRSGWPQPIENHQNLTSAQLDATLPYFDGALLIRHSRAEIYCEMGLIDTTCPPSAVWSSVNNASGKKTVNCVPYRTHAWPSGLIASSWREQYLKPREAFIDNYLK